MLGFTNLYQREDGVWVAVHDGKTLWYSTDEITWGRIAADKGEPVAEIGPVFTLVWAGSDSVASIVNKHGLKVGDKLYAHPAAPVLTETEREALELCSVYTNEYVRTLCDLVRRLTGEK